MMACGHIHGRQGQQGQYWPEFHFAWISEIQSVSQFFFFEKKMHNKGYNF